MRLRDADHTEVGRQLLRLGRGQAQLTSDQVLAALVQVLVEDDVVHGLRKVGVDLVQQCGCVG